MSARPQTKADAAYTTSGGSKNVVAATANMKTNFMGLMGVTQMKIGLDSQAKWGNSRLRVALVRWDGAAISPRAVRESSSAPG